MIPLVRSAQDAGHDVLVIGDSGLVGHPELQAVACRVLPDRAEVLPGFDEVQVKRAAEALPPAERPAYDLTSFLAWGTALAPAAAAVIEDFGADLVVRELAFHAGWLAAEKLGLPSALFSLVPIPERLMVGIVPGPYADALASVGSSEKPEERVAAGLAVYALPPTWFGDQGPPESAVLMRPGEPTVIDDGSIAAIIDGLGRDRPLVYVTLGTTFADEPGLFRTVLDGAASLDVDVIATTGPTLDPGSLTGYRDNVRVVRFIPQSLLLPHCNAVVAHAGYGTSFGAMAHGLPMVTVPIASSDNPLNAAHLARSGAAVAISEAERTADTVADALRRVIEDPSYRTAARAIRDELQHMPGPEAVVDELERFARKSTRQGQEP